MRPRNGKSFKSIELGDKVMAEFRSLYKTVVGVEDHAELKHILNDLNRKRLC